MLIITSEIAFKHLNKRLSKTFTEHFIMVVARKYSVIKSFRRKPERTDFKIVEEELPPVNDGEILVKTEWLSVDPYQRSFHRYYKVPYTQFGYNVGRVLESKDPNFPEGCKVVTHEGWCDHFIVNPSKDQTPPSKVYKVPNLQGLCTSMAIGAVCMHGATAYFSMLDCLDVKPGETVVVSSAAGAVGSLAGQIAKIKGCKVIGLTGSDVKVKWLEQELNFDNAINYKKTDVNLALKEYAPEGIDCFLDGVGGELSNLVMGNMNRFGRVCIIGWLSGYNDENPQVSIVQPNILNKQLSVQGFNIFDRFETWPKAFDQMVQWILGGQIKAREYIIEGFDKAFETFNDVMEGVNVGKALVKVDLAVGKY